MKNSKYIFTLIGLFFLFSCGNELKKTESEPEIVEVNTTEKKVYTAANSEATFKDPKVGAVYENYIQLKTALVNSNASNTATAGASLLTAFKNVEADQVVLEATQTISASDDVEAQRVAFVTVTNAVEKMLDGALESGVIYKQFCPMAFDFEGGYWLSNSKQIYNPYFGDKMLRCGKVDSEIR